MAKRLLMCVVAVVGIVAMVLTGCAGGGLGERVTVKLLIRNNDNRLYIGDYVGDQLEALGFKVVRQYGTGTQLAPIWQGDPHLGLWNVYTAAWISTAVSRDEGANFGFFYTPLAGEGPLWEAYTPTDEFLEVATKLWNYDFSTMSERQALFEDAVPLSMEDSVRIFLDDRTSYYALRSNVALAADAYGGVEGSWLFGHTVHFHDETGVPLLPHWDHGSTKLTLRVGMGDLLVQPWNPVGGSNWAFDQMPIRATGDNGLEYDTRDGLAWPHVVEKADVTVLQGLPIGTNPGHEWITLHTSATPIAVPETAWADWNATSQTWITAGAGKTAKTKTVVYYPHGTFGRPLHDGSTLDKGDFLLYAIMQFDRAKEGSDIYDASYLPEFQAFMEHFKGVEFNFDDPNYDLIVTTYDDLWYMDAELIARGNSWFPSGTMTGGSNLGPWTWHNLALGILAEKDLRLAFSQNKATQKGVEWLSFISGPSLEILQGYLTQALNASSPLYGYVPYESFLGDYISETDAVHRYQNLQTWKNDKGHFWVASGPYYLKSVDTTNNIVQLAAFEDYPDDGDMWFFLLDPEPVTPPEHKGAWVDEIVMSIVPEDQAVTKLQNNQIDVYAYGMSDPDDFERVKDDPNLTYYMSAGLFDELTFNPSHDATDPFFPATGELNPFAIPAIREAMNWAIDRSYIRGEIWGGMAYERYTCVGTQTGDYINRYPALFAATEAEYAYDFDRADAAIEAAMLAIPGVTRDSSGRYWFTPP
jgi:peptide/nickel transport system substrate-binding protein